MLETRAWTQRKSQHTTEKQQRSTTNSPFSSCFFFVFLFLFFSSVFFSSFFFQGILKSDYMNKRTSQESHTTQTFAKTIEIRFGLKIATRQLSIQTPNRFQLELSTTRDSVLNKLGVLLGLEHKYVFRFSQQKVLYGSTRL